MSSSSNMLGDDGDADEDDDDDDDDDLPSSVMGDGGEGLTGFVVGANAKRTTKDQ